MDKSKGNKSNYVYIEDFDHEDFEDLFTIKLSIKKKKAFWMNLDELLTMFWRERNIDKLLQSLLRN